MKKYILFTLFLLCASTNVWSAAKQSSARQQAALELTKQKWITWANNNVETEKLKFLAFYGLPPEALNHQKAIEAVDYNTAKLLNEYVTSTKKSNLLIAKSDMTAVQRVAEKVFQPYDVKIINNGTLVNNLNVLHKPNSKVCYITLNVSQEAKNTATLEALLRHELSHVIHADNFNKTLIQLLAYMFSDDDTDEIEQHCYPISRACETRADVYAITHSTEHGEQLISWLKNLAHEDHVDIETHPQPSERIALLEQIKAELIAAVANAN